MAKRMAARLTISELMAEASDFSRHAWRQCWLPILLIVVGHTVLFVHQHAGTGEGPSLLMRAAASLLMLFYIPLYGGLYRIAIGGEHGQGLGFGGLQWNGVEWRLIAVGVVIAFVTGVVLMPFLAATGLLALVFHSHHLVSFGPLGTLAFWTVLSIPVWILFGLLMAPRISRLMLGWAYSTARGKTEPFGGWEPSERSGWPIAVALILAWAPMLLGYLGVMAFTMVEANALTVESWPLPEATVAGVLLGLIKAAVVAPLSVGVLTGAFWLLEEREAHPATAEEANHPEAFGRSESLEQAYADGPEPGPEHEAEAHHADVGAAAAAAAAALAAQHAAELDLHPTQIDHSVSARGEDPAQTLRDEAEPHAEAAPPAVPESPHDSVSTDSDLQASDSPDPVAEAATPDVHPGDAPAPDHPTTDAVIPDGSAADHAAAAHAEEAAAAAAAAAAVAAHAAEAAHADHDHGVVNADPHDPPPSASNPVETTNEIEPLSPWPHSVLPPWRASSNSAAAEAAADPVYATLTAQPPASTPSTEPSRDIAEETRSQVFPPLAHGAEPDHRFVEITELD